MSMILGCAINVPTAKSFSLSELPDNPIYKNEEYKDYLRSIRHKIAENSVKYSYGSGTGDVALIFELKANGKLEKLQVDTSKTTASKKTIKEATIAFKRSLPFPPFPETMPKEFRTLTFTILLSYELEKSGE